MLVHEKIKYYKEQIKQFDIRIISLFIWAELNKRGIIGATKQPEREWFYNRPKWIEWLCFSTL